MITLYDLASTTNRPWSPSVWKVRLSLNYKGLPFRTEWIEYPDIAPLYHKHNLPPTSMKNGDVPFYTVPVIQDDISGDSVFVADTIEIARYLDKTYPSTPRLIPEGEKEMKKLLAFSSLLKLLSPQLLALLCQDTHRILANEASKDHISLARAKDLSAWFPGIQTLDDIHFTEDQKKEMWNGLQASLDALSKDFGGREGFNWYLGDAISLADFVLAGGLMWIRELYGQGSNIWADITTWNDGKWGTIVGKLAVYQEELEGVRERH